MTDGLMLDFLEKHKLGLWFDDNACLDYYDDLQKYASDIASSTLLLMNFIHSIKYGDCTSIRACHKIYALFFLASGGNSSKYSPSIMNMLLDYESLSEKEKVLVDIFSSVNCYGVDGCGVPADMVCEWGVKQVKGLESRFASNYGVSLAERAIRTSNVTVKIKDNLFDSMLCENLKSTPGHSSKFIKDWAVEQIRYTK